MLGICYGFQLSVVEFAKNVCGIKNANSAEISLLTHTLETDELVIDYLDSEYEKEIFGSTMRLGKFPVKILDKESLAYKLYGKEIIEERHRHRLEVNLKY